jgi:SRSO17 transposase
MEAHKTRTSLLEAPEAQELLEQAKLRPSTVRECEQHLTKFVQRYLPCFYRKEQRENARMVIEGLLSGLERKTCEPIARQHGVPRKPVQFFVGNGVWDDEAVMAELRRHVREELGDPGAVLVVDASGFVKKGTESCGVKRQWCGRFGKVENCQVGMFLCYASSRGHAPLDRRLYLPEDWAADSQHRNKCHVPKQVRFQSKWRIALEMVDRCCVEQIPHAWVAGDDDFGRCNRFRAKLRGRGERYVLDVPANTLVRDLEARPPRGKRVVPFVQAREWAQRQPASAWQKLTLRSGTKGPLEVEALSCLVRARDEKGRIGAAERLLAVRRVVDGQTRTDYSLSNDRTVPLQQLAAAHGQRHRVEQMLEEAKGEAGLGQYEVRSWIGWHHHMTLALLALWFLILETGRLGEKKMSGRHSPADADDLQLPAS